MTGEHLGPKSAFAALEELFLGGGRSGNSNDGVALVLIDEMDLLLTRKHVLHTCMPAPLASQCCMLSLVARRHSASRSSLDTRHHVAVAADFHCCSTGQPSR